MKRMTRVAVAAFALLTAPAAVAQEQYIGEIRAVGFTYCPRFWAEANGQLMQIAQNNALFALFGTTYGGDGRTTFALPDLRGRVAVHAGAGPGLPPATQGQKLGSPSTTLTTVQMPSHSHALRATSGDPDDPSPDNALLGTFPAAGNPIYSLDPADLTMSGQAIGNSGGNQAFDQHQPSLVILYCVALQGIFPPRN